MTGKAGAPLTEAMFYVLHKKPEGGCAEFMIFAKSAIDNRQ